MRSSLVALALAASAAAPAFRAADPAHRWAFPRDHHAHPGYRSEWWYVTGVLEDADAPARRLGFQLTFFRLGLALGAAGGSSLAAVLVRVVNPAFFGWSLGVSIPWGVLAEQALAILAAAAVASLYPALAASRTPAAELSRDAL